MCFHAHLVHTVQQTAHAHAQLLLASLPDAALAWSQRSMTGVMGIGISSALPPTDPWLGNRCEAAKSVENKSYSLTDEPILEPCRTCMPGAEQSPTG